MRYLVALTLAAALLSGCASGTASQNLIRTGASIKAVGSQWNAAQAAFVEACKPSAPKLMKDDCDKAKEFDNKMRKAYPLASQLFEAAVATNDVAMAGDAKATIRRLSVEAASFALKVGLTIQEVQ